MNQVVAAGSVQAARIVFRRGMQLAAGGYAVITVAVLTLGGPAATLLAGSPPIAASAREFVLTVGPVFGCAGLIVVAVTAMEQTGHAPAAALMNASYFGAVLAIGWVVMDATGDLRDVYRTLMISTIIGTAIGLPVSRYFARRPRALRREPAQPPGAGT
jgi:Na+-driven multidrug efflux pump